jgi:hypothetical protein
MQLAAAAAELHFRLSKKLFFWINKKRRDFSLRLFIFWNCKLIESIFNYSSTAKKRRGQESGKERKSLFRFVFRIPRPKGGFPNNISPAFAVEV